MSREDRLPVWAKLRLEGLRNEVRELKQRLGEEPIQHPYVAVYRHGAPVPVAGVYDHVQIALPGGMLSLRPIEGRLVLHETNGQPIAVLPESSNSFGVAVVDASTRGGTDGFR